ncbi:Lipopolysaccharide-modifying protein [Trema orientale]|uniref:Lipopolysaccharide-modifying protein n=1 Tax=Trema orientale TaxID=63057 RepID=A0A2P5EZB9_TREOI|nr:Lipopolysaccharide-modifying protein [Trema orientale]
MRENEIKKETREDVTIWQPFMKSSAVCASVFLFMLFIFVAIIMPMHFPDTADILTTLTSHKYHLNNTKFSETPRPKIEIPVNCTTYEATKTCPSDYPTTYNPEEDRDRPPPPTCPDFFRWIYEDLKPWAETGISRENVERAKDMGLANFRLVILKGKAYLETYRRSFQTRDLFSLWGILQLLRRYPGRVPDLDLMFNCGDPPMVLSRLFTGINATTVPPVFNYCKDKEHLDIIFPDWSFWGWAEINIRPWDPLLKDIKVGNNKTKWVNKDPYAFWKGNPTVAQTRRDLLRCNPTPTQDWNARLFVNDWRREERTGFRQSNLADQCTHRYKIYIEGVAWSVSQKYILACDSVPLIIHPRFYDFFSRGLIPLHHYWPVKDYDKCRSIKFAVEWGNSHLKEAEEMGKATSEFIQEDLKMDNVYDYMFHSLNEYAKLLTYEPTIPEKATELCSEAMACKERGLHKEFMLQSQVKSPADRGPCAMPPPFSPASLHSFLQRKTDTIKEVDLMEKQYYENQTKKP